MYRAFTQRQGQQHQKCFFYVIIVFLMTAIVVVSFYEPRWIHSGAFRAKNIREHFVEPFENVLDLRDLITQSTLKGKKSKALQSIPVETEYLRSNNMKFIICKTLSERIKSIQNPSNSAPRDPLDVANMEKDLIVHNFGAKNQEFDFSLVLNKFNTIPDHCLLLSNQYKPQIDLISKEEFSLWAWLTVKLKAIGFYNSNKIAGASQPHKHLQIVPHDSLANLVKGSTSTIPLNELILPKIDNAEIKVLSQDSDISRPNEFTNTLEQLPFHHYYVALDHNSFNVEDITRFIQYGELLEKSYHYILQKLHIDKNLLEECSSLQKSYSHHEFQKCDEKGAYNVVLSPHYLFVVPRRSLGSIDGINGLGFLGIFLATSDAKLAKLREVGPLHALQEVTKPKP